MLCIIQRAHVIACIAVAALIPLTPVRSQAFEAERGEIAALKGAYIECERRAADGKLDTSEIMKCSTVYEELKRREFGGNFKLLKAWADTQVAAKVN